MVTHLVKHTTPNEGSSPNRVLVSRIMGAIGGKIKPAKSHAEMRYGYEIDPANGDSVIVETTIFPSGKYDALDFTPSWHGHRFVGWFKNAASPSATIPNMIGEITDNTSVIYSIKTIYAHWQLPVVITFDAASNGGSMPDGWSVPYYYAGQPFGALPSPTHESLSFVGWYLNGERLSSMSIVPEGGGVLVAEFSAQSYSIDLNDGSWELDSSSVVDTTLYDGVYKSISNTGIDDSMSKLYIDVVGYTSFKILIASNSEDSYDYTIAMEADVDPIDIPYEVPSDHSTSEGVKASTAGECNEVDPSDPIQYKEVIYSLDGGSHRICVLYRKDSSDAAGSDCGYLIIPKEQ